MAEGTNGSRPSSTANKATPKTHRQEDGIQAIQGADPPWGYALGHAWEEQRNEQCPGGGGDAGEDQTETATTTRRSGGALLRRQAENNVADSMDGWAYGAYGDVDKLLETVVNNLEVTNDLDIQPEVRCRVLMISTLESFT